jgi:hypothetical protein
MGYNKGPWTEERIASLYKEGRGEGTGAAYRPFLEVTDLSSRGTSRQILGRKTSRVHHLFSNVEYQFFLMLEWSPDVIDIREQYPLPRDLTLAVATEGRLSHPYYPGTKVPAVMTIDAVVTRIANGQEVYEAYDIKRTDEAENYRSIEKLEITRATCEMLEMPHRLIFHSMLPQQKIENIEWILGAQVDEQDSARRQLQAEHTARLLQYLSSEHEQGKTLRQCCDAYDIAFGLPSGSALRFARVLMYERALQPNLALANLANASLREYQFLAQPGRLRAAGE